MSKKPAVLSQPLNEEDIRQQMERDGRISGVIALSHQEIKANLGNQEDFYEFLGLKLCGNELLLEIDAVIMTPEADIPKNKKVLVAVSGNAWWVEPGMTKLLAQLEAGNLSGLTDASTYERDKSLVEGVVLDEADEVEHQTRG